MSRWTHPLRVTWGAFAIQYDGGALRVRVADTVDVTFDFPDQTTADKAPEPRPRELMSGVRPGRPVDPDTTEG